MAIATNATLSVNSSFSVTGDSELKFGVFSGAVGVMFASAFAASIAAYSAAFTASS